ncbi:hypothetical protein AAMO2058_001748900, partial [Amorphochlora amoebiformis]
TTRSRRKRLRNWRVVLKKREEEEIEDRIAKRTGKPLNIKCPSCGEISVTNRDHRVHLQNCLGDPKEEKVAEKRLLTILPNISSALGINPEAPMATLLMGLGKQIMGPHKESREKFENLEPAFITTGYGPPIQPLPEGWKEYTDKRTSRKYYHHKGMQKTVWHRPTSKDEVFTSEVRMSKESLPAGWTIHQDSNGRLFYYHSRLQKTQWERPRYKDIKEVEAEFKEKLAQTKVNSTDKGRTIPEDHPHRFFDPSLANPVLGGRKENVYAGARAKVKKEDTRDPLDKYMEDEILPEVVEGNRRVRLYEKEEEKAWDRALKKAGGDAMPNLNLDDDSAKITHTEKLTLPMHKMKVIIGKRGMRIAYIQKITDCYITVTDNENYTSFQNLTGMIWAKDKMSGIVQRAKLKGLMTTNSTFRSALNSTLYIFGGYQRVKKAKDMILGYLESFKNRFVDRTGQYRRKSFMKWQVREVFKIRHTRDYEALELPFGAKRAEIEKAYKRLKVKWHPDKNPKRREYAHKRYLEIERAYQNINSIEERHEMYVLTHSAGEVKRYILNNNITLPKAFYLAEGKSHRKAKRRLGLPEDVQEMRKMLEYWDAEVPIPCLGGAGKLWMKPRISTEPGEIPEYKKLKMPEEERRKRHLHFKYGDHVITNRTGLEGMVGICMTRPIEGYGVIVEFGGKIGRRVIPELEVDDYTPPPINETEEMRNASKRVREEAQRLADIQSHANAEVRRILYEWETLYPPAPTPSPVYVGEKDPELAGYLNGDALE